MNRSLYALRTAEFTALLKMLAMGVLAQFTFMLGVSVAAFVFVLLGSLAG